MVDIHCNAPQRIASAAYSEEDKSSGLPSSDITNQSYDIIRLSTMVAHKSFIDIDKLDRLDGKAGTDGGVAQGVELTTASRG